MASLKVKEATVLPVSPGKWPGIDPRRRRRGGGILVDKKCVFSPVDLAVIKKLAVFFLAFPITVRCVISGSSICAVRKKNHCYCLDGFQETLPRLFIGFQKGCTKLLWRK